MVFSVAISTKIVFNNMFNMVFSLFYSINIFHYLQTAYKLIVVQKIRRLHIIFFATLFPEQKGITRHERDESLWEEFGMVWNNFTHTQYSLYKGTKSSSRKFKKYTVKPKMVKISRFFTLMIQWWRYCLNKYITDYYRCLYNHK